MSSVNPSNIVQNRVAPVKGHYQVSFRHPRTGKLLKTGSYRFSDKKQNKTKTHPSETQLAQIQLWTRKDMNPPPLSCTLPSELSKTQPPPLGASNHSMHLALSSLGKGIKTLFSSLVNISVNSFTICVSSPNTQNRQIQRDCMWVIATGWEKKIGSDSNGHGVSFRLMKLF